MRIGPSFTDELKAAGVAGLPFSWRESDGFVRMDDPLLTDAQRTAIQAVIAAHDPTIPSAAQRRERAKQAATKALKDHLRMMETSDVTEDMKTLVKLLNAVFT